jgi:hypothetical protein
VEWEVTSTDGKTPAGRNWEPFFVTFSGFSHLVWWKRERRGDVVPDRQDDPELAARPFGGRLHKKGKG